MAFSVVNSQENKSAIKSSIIYEGQILKQGRYNRSWRSRWFILYSTRKLVYFADKNESIAMKPIAEIDLTQVENIINDRSKDIQNKYVFELITQSRTFYLACLDTESLNLWNKYLYQMTFGTQIHTGWLIKKGDRIQSWRKRWFILNNLHELRYYEDETQSKFKGIINLSNISIIRHGDKDEYGYEYTIEIITSDRKWVLVTTYYELREIWMNKLNEALCNGIKMNLLYKGWLWKFENNDRDVPNWSKKFYGIDRETLNLYYTQSYNKFKQFSSTLFFDKSYYENAMQTQLQGNLPIKNAVVEQYIDVDGRFDNTTQKSKEWIFSVRNVLGEHYFAVDNELCMQEWLHYLNWVIGSGPDKVINKVTRGAMDDKIRYEKYLDDDYLDKHSNDSRRKTVIKIQKHDISNFGPDGLPVMQDTNNKPQKQTYVQKQRALEATNDMTNNDKFSKRELELRSMWNDIILPYKNNALKLESEAQFPCNLDSTQSTAHSQCLCVNCACVKRVSVIMNYYMYWMNDKQNNNKLMGMSYVLLMLSDYGMTELLNDFFHLKKFHAEDIANNHEIEALSTYFIQQYGECVIEQCVSLCRNNLNYIKCKDNKILRKWYYINDNEKIIDTSLEWEEITIQQILDMIHCYIYHGCHFSLYDTTSQTEIENIRNIYATRKQKFNENRYITNMYSYHHIPYEPMDIETPKDNNYYITPDITNVNNYSDKAQMYEYTPNSFGIDMEHNKYTQALNKYGPAKYTDFKQEILSHETCSLSVMEFNIICVKANILLSTFMGKLLKAHSTNDLTLTYELDTTLYTPNECMNEQICQSLLIYSNCEELRCELMNTYFKMNNIHESDKDCRHRHYNIFYNWGKLLYTAVMVFGTDIYNDIDDTFNNLSFIKAKTQQKFYYHNVSKPVLFNKFNTSFFGPTSLTTCKNVALIHMPTQEKDGIVLELDTNNVGWSKPCYLNMSLFSNNPSECEQLFHGGASLGIHNIISVSQLNGLSNLSNYTSAITLLRYIIGDTNRELRDNDKYTEEILDEFDQNICKHLEWLIDYQVDIYKNNRNINDYKNFNSNVPLYMAIILNSWCSNKEGIISLNMNLLRTLPKPLQHKFIYESPDNINDYNINWSIIFNLFPNCNKIWIRGLYFNNYLCEQYVNFLCSEHIISEKYKIDGIVFSCMAETDWKLWVNIAKKHSSIIKQMGWLITASPPKKNIYGDIDTGRVSFIKRINNNKPVKKSEIEKETYEQQKLKQERIQKEKLETDRLEKEKLNKITDEYKSDNSVSINGSEKDGKSQQNGCTDSDFDEHNHDSNSDVVTEEEDDINVQILSELEDIVNKEMENMLFIQSQFNQFKMQIQSGKYGPVSCPGIGGNGNGNGSDNVNGLNFNVNEKGKNNSNGNNNNKQSGNGNDKNNGGHKPNKYNKYAQTTAMNCNHLHECNDCIQTVKYWQNMVAGQAQHIQHQTKTHLSFQKLLAKAITNTAKKKSKRKKQRLKVNQIHIRQNNEANSDPISLFQNSNNKTYISNKIIQNIKQNAIKAPQYIRNFMNASIELQQNMDEIKEDRKIMDFGYIDKNTNEHLYCVLQKKNHANYKWKMEDTLFTTNELSKLSLPPTTASQFAEKKNKKTQVYVNKIKTKMNAKIIQEMINKCKWNKLPLYIRKNNEQRITLSITPELLGRHIKMQSSDNINLIPIIGYNNNGTTRIDFVWIIRIDKDINIGISLEYNEKYDIVRINGIYIDKNYLLQQHYLLSPYHMNNCNCLNKFETIINDIHIGNPDDLYNKVKDYKQRYETLKEFYNSFRHENESKESIQNSAEIIMNMHDNGRLFTDITTTPPVASTSSSVSICPSTASSTNVSPQPILPSVHQTSVVNNNNNNNMQLQPPQQPNYVGYTHNNMSLPNNGMNGYPVTSVSTMLNIPIIPVTYVNNTMQNMNYFVPQQPNNNNSYSNRNNFNFNYQ